LQDKVDKGNFQITGYGWHADYPDPENFFFLFYGRNAPPQGNNNSRYKNPEFDRIFEKMSTMDNTPERLKLVHQLNDILVEDAPILLLDHNVNFSLNQIWAPRVSSNSLMANGPKYVILNPQLRSQKQQEWNQKPVWPLAALGGLIVAAVGFGIYWTRRHDV
jgi:ABC-type oligopeptide transport system substrate-binding subunit